jgi:hypothetical protein
MSNLSRRSFAVGALAACGCAHLSANSKSRAILDRAIDAAGGRAALNAAHVLAWTGTAVVHQGERRIEIGVETVVEPFVYARSETWLLSQGNSSRRTLEIDGTEGTVVRGGQRTAMEAGAVAHERQQFAIYGLMRLVPLLDSGVVLDVETPPAAAPVNVRYALMARHADAPETVLMFDGDYRLVAADNVVVNPETGKPPIPQRFLFEGVIEGGGLRWPRTLRILQNGQPYFDLTLDSLTPRSARR